MIGQFREYGVLFVLHAIASLIGLSIMCFGNMFHFFGCIGMLWEFTTIMINNRYPLARTRTTKNARARALPLTKHACMQACNICVRTSHLHTCMFDCVDTVATGVGGCCLSTGTRTRCSTISTGSCLYLSFLR